MHRYIIIRKDLQNCFDKIWFDFLNMKYPICSCYSTVLEKEILKNHLSHNTTEKGETVSCDWACKTIAKCYYNYVFKNFTISCVEKLRVWMFKKVLHKKLNTLAIKQNMLINPK